MSFIPEFSTDSIWYRENMSRCLSDHLDELEGYIETLDDGKADADHTHSGYAASNHTHTGYAASNHTHSGYALLDHLHNPTIITKAGEDLNNYVTAGIFSFPQAYAPANVPAGTNGWLIVIPWENGSSTIKQIWLRHGTIGSSDFETYVRTKVGSVNEWGAWSKFYTTSNPPTAAEVGAISKNLQFTNDSGGVKENLSDQDVLAAIAAKAQGVYTFYAIAGSKNNPRSTGGWRYLVHKTNTTYGWLLAFCSDGSIYTNYLDNGAWQGWKAVYEVYNSALLLWSGPRLMTDAQTVTPSKKLSECRNGWMLEWSDYDSSGDTSGTSNNYNIVHTPIYKRNVAGNWAGQSMMFAIPNYISDDGKTQAIAIKQLRVHDTKLVGYESNDQNANNLDVVLRAVYEF